MGLDLQDEDSRLLFDDPDSIHYGSFGEQQMTGQNDPLEAQREIEALQRVVARTSEYARSPKTRGVVEQRADVLVL